MYQAKAGNVAYAGEPGLLSKLADGARGRILTAATAASILAGCQTLGMDIGGRDNSTGREYNVRVGQEVPQPSLKDAFFTFARPVTAVFNGVKYDLYSDFKRAVDAALCREKELLNAGNETVPDISQRLYNEACVEYSETGTGKILESLTESQRTGLSRAVKDRLNSRVATVAVASNGELAALPTTYTINDVSIDKIIDPRLRGTLAFAGDAALWAAFAVLASSGSSSSTTTQQQGGCFTAETKVAMSDGSLKEMSKLRIGDKVKSFDFKNKKKVSSKVTALFTFDKKSFLHLNGLKVTETHPFAVGIDSWKEAGELKVGDQVLGNNKITIKNIKRVNKPVSVFNITVNGTHNYYVDDRENSFLVHNKGFGQCFIKESKVTMADKTIKNIEKIKVGDKVLGFNLKTKKWGKYAVTELQKGNKKGYFVINKKLKVSPVHQIFVNGMGKTAPEIKLNDTIINGHKKTKVISIEFIDKKADRHNIVLGRKKDVLFMVNDVLVYNGW